MRFTPHLPLSQSSSGVSGMVTRRSPRPRPLSWANRMAKAVSVAPPSPNSRSFRPSPREVGFRNCFRSRFTTKWYCPIGIFSFRNEWVLKNRQEPRPSRSLGGGSIRVTGLQNPVGGVKDALGGTFTDRLTLCVRLNISAAKFRAGQSQRFAAKQGHGLGFDFGHTARRLVGVGHVSLGAVKN